ESSIWASGPVRGTSFQMGLDLADAAALSDYTLRAFSASATTYASMPWPGHHTLALRAAGAIASGTYTRSGTYFVGGYDLNQSLVDAVTSGVFNGSFVLRGYPAHAYAGREYVLANAEYRLPIYIVDHGISTLPVYLRRLDANLFIDWGGAFNDFNAHAFKW